MEFQINLMELTESTRNRKEELYYTQTYPIEIRCRRKGSDWISRENCAKRSTWKTSIFTLALPFFSVSFSTKARCDVSLLTILNCTYARVLRT